MASGLLLLLIVAAWLVVLVPMALRSHDSAVSARSADRFSQAMRVLSRRGAAGRAVVLPGRPAPPSVVAVGRAWAGERPVLTAAERRRRVLVSLLGLCVLTLAGGLVGPSYLLVVSGLLLALTAAFVVHLRRLAVRRAVLARRAATAPAATAVPVAPQVRGVPRRMPPRPVPLGAPLPAPASRHEDPLPAAGAWSGSDAGFGSDPGWSPVPVPRPVYAGLPQAPARTPRVLDLTTPGEWSAATGAGEDVVLTDGSELDEILERRRVVGGW